MDVLGLKDFWSANENNMEKKISPRITNYICFSDNAANHPEKELQILYETNQNSNPIHSYMDFLISHVILSSYPSKLQPRDPSHLRLKIPTWYSPRVVLLCFHYITGNKQLAHILLCSKRNTAYGDDASWLTQMSKIISLFFPITLSKMR